MGFWGGTIGGIAGFALGGPLGAILGAVIGNKLGNMAPGGQKQEALKLAFSTALVVLGAKMAKSDGRVSPEEVAAFKQVFRQLFKPSAADMEWAGKIFNEARKDAVGYEPYARQIATMVPPQVLEELLVGLLVIAYADGVLHPAEVEYLRDVARLFGFEEHEFQRILNRGKLHDSAPSRTDPYKVLGISKNLNNADITRAYRKLAQENHPDRLVSQGLPEEMLAQANEKMAQINASYDLIRKERSF